MNNLFPIGAQPAIVPHDIGNQIERLEPANHSRDEHDLPRLARLREQTEQLVRRSSQDDAGHPPMDAGHFMQEIGSHFRNQRYYDDDVSQDGVGQKVSLSGAWAYCAIFLGRR